MIPRLLSVIFVALSILGLSIADDHAGATKAEGIDLPPPATTGTDSVEACIASRRTVRSFSSTPLDRGQVSQLLWACQGVTGGEPWKRAAPSGGGLHPLDVYLVVGAGGVEGVEAGVYHYLPAKHQIALVSEGDRREALARAALDQEWMTPAPVWIALAAVERRTARRYGQQAGLYVPFEAGCASENAALQGEALGLGTCVVGAFTDDVVARLLGLGRGEQPLALMPFGRRRR